MSDFLNRARDLADQHDDKVDQVLEQVGDQINERTGGQHSEIVDRVIDEAQSRTGDGDTKG